MDFVDQFLYGPCSLQEGWSKKDYYLYEDLDVQPVYA